MESSPDLLGPLLRGDGGVSAGAAAAGGAAGGGAWAAPRNFTVIPLRASLPPRPSSTSTAAPAPSSLSPLAPLSPAAAAPLHPLPPEVAAAAANAHSPSFPSPSTTTATTPSRSPLLISPPLTSLPTATATPPSAISPVPLQAPAPVFSQVDVGLTLSPFAKRQVLLQKSTVKLRQTYQTCNPSLSFQSSEELEARILTTPSTPLPETPHDNVDHNYILKTRQILVGPEDQYEVLDLLGTGSFGQVVKCVSAKTGQVVAIKLVKNLPAYHVQGMVEVEVVKKINAAYDPGEYPLLKLLSHFVFDNHLCIVFECLGYSLYDLIVMNKYKGVSLKLVRKFADQLVLALDALDKLGVIHCDLKPENILLVNSNSPSLKVIDFGSACYRGHTVYSYIQSRFYRAPEVLLGNPYSSFIDVWSCACVCFEMYYGLPLFPGANQLRMLKRFEDTLSAPPRHLIESGKYARKFYERTHTGYTLMDDRQWLRKQNEKTSRVPPFRDYFKGAKRVVDIVGGYPLPSKTSGAELIALIEERESFSHFLSCMLQWDPEKRWRTSDLKHHPFLQQAPLNSLPTALIELQLPPHLLHLSAPVRNPFLPASSSSSSPSGSVFSASSIQAQNGDAVKKRASNASIVTTSTNPFAIGSSGLNSISAPNFHAYHPSMPSLLPQAKKANSTNQLHSRHKRQNQYGVAFRTNESQRRRQQHSTQQQRQQQPRHYQPPVVSDTQSRLPQQLQQLPLEKQSFPQRTEGSEIEPNSSRLQPQQPPRYSRDYLRGRTVSNDAISRLQPSSLPVALSYTQRDVPTSSPSSLYGVVPPARDPDSYGAGAGGRTGSRAGSSRSRSYSSPAIALTTSQELLRSHQPHPVGLQFQTQPHLAVVSQSDHPHYRQASQFHSEVAHRGSYYDVDAGPSDRGLLFEMDESDTSSDYPSAYSSSSLSAYSSPFISSYASSASSSYSQLPRYYSSRTPHDRNIHGLTNPALYSYSSLTGPPASKFSTLPSAKTSPHLREIRGGGRGDAVGGDTSDTFHRVDTVDALRANYRNRSHSDLRYPRSDAGADGGSQNLRGPTPRNVGGGGRSRGLSDVLSTSAARRGVTGSTSQWRERENQGGDRVGERSREGSDISSLSTQFQQAFISSRQIHPTKPPSLSPLSPSASSNSPSFYSQAHLVSPPQNIVQTLPPPTGLSTHQRSAFLYTPLGASPADEPTLRDEYHQQRPLLGSYDDPSAYFPLTMTSELGLSPGTAREPHHAKD